MTRLPTSADSVSQRRSPSAVTRRRVLACAGVGVVTAVAGCSTLADYFGDMVLEDVNVFNETDGAVAGSIEIVDPAGDVVLEESFDLSAQEGDVEGDEESEALAAYDDVWTEAGDYEVSVELDEGTDVRGESSANESITIDDPDDEMAAIILGNEDIEDGIHVAVGTSLTDFE